MLRRLLSASVVLLFAAAIFAARAQEAGRGPGTCSTFLLRKQESLFVGHNLDESIPVPGLILVNPRGTVKESLGYQDMLASSGRVEGLPRKSWTARFGSITYTNSGREFIDGGMNEAGFYVGEMTLLGSIYPKDPKLVRIYHHAWMQYLLDTCGAVPEALAGLAEVVPDGHCQWHFFLADRAGRSAVIEFVDGKTLVCTGESLPVRACTNFTYASSLKRLATFEGFGGMEKLDWTYRPGWKVDLRFAWAAAMLKRLEEGAGGITAGHAFDILQQMWCDGNRWSLVFDPVAMRVHWNTHRGRKVRYADFSSFDFSQAAPVLALDIHQELAGDAAAGFAPLTRSAEHDYVRRFWDGVDAGFWGGLLWRPKLLKAIGRYQERCRALP